MRPSARVAMAANVLVCLLVLVIGRPALGQQVDGEAELGARAAQLSQAREAYNSAAQAYQERRYKDAIDLFRRANKLTPNAAFAYNIGLAYEDMGDPALALRHYRSYVRAAPNAADRNDVETRIRRLEMMLRDKGVQQVTITTSPPGATFAIDDEPIGITPWTGEIGPGHHRVSLQLRGYEDEERYFDLPPGRAIDVPVTLTEEKPKVVETRLPAAYVADERWHQRVAPTTWAILGGSVAALGVASAFELARGGKEQQARDEQVQVDADLRLDEARSHQAWGRTFAVLGGALAVTGGALLYLDVNAKRTPRLAADCSLEGCRVRVRSRF